MKAVRFLGAGALLAMTLAAGGCAAIKENRGFIVDPTLTESVQPGIDNKQSVQGTLGTPTFTSQFGRETWYYIASTTSQKPFTTPKIREHTVLAIQFQPSGDVASSTFAGMEKVVHLHPDHDHTPTLGRERGFFQDLFGNIGQVGSFGTGAPAGGPAGGGPNGS